MWSLLGIDPFRRSVLLRAGFAVAAALVGARLGTGVGILTGGIATVWGAWDLGRRADPLRRSVLRLALESDRETEPDLDENLRAMAATVSRARTLLDESRRRAERERDDVRGILEATRDGIVVIGSEDRVHSLNAAARLLLNLQADPLGRPLREVVPEHRVLAFTAELRAGTVPAPARLWIGEGEDARCLRLSGAVIQGERQVRRIVLVFHDVTDLEHLQQVRTDFVANVTHEMRSPLASILGYAETLEEGGLDAELQADALRRILRNARRLDDIIRDLIELSRLEHARNPETTPTDVAELVQGCVSAFADLAHEGGVALDVEVEGDPGLVELDSALVHQALTNLVENAVKYTPDSGSVRVRARMVTRPYEAPDGEQVLARTLELVVSDTGPGIPLEHHGRIFERFYRVDTARSRALGGTGLGLAIVKHAAVVHGGSVQLESVAGEGATFRLLLPVDEGPAVLA